MISAEVLQTLDFVVAGGAGNDFRPELFGQQHAARADATAGAQYQHLVAFFDGVVGDDHAVRRAVGHRQGCCLLVGHVSGHGNQLISGDQTFFGKTAMHHLAHQALLFVERVHQHAVAFVPARDARANFQNFTGQIEADNHGHRHLDAGHAAHREYIVIVE